MSFEQLLNERILILDGGLGTMIQSYNLTEEDYRGERFACCPTRQQGNHDLLSLTRPDIIRSIQRQYLDAGADIFSTNTFNANVISMADYGMQAQVREINLAAGRLARGEADRYMREHPGRTVFVAGSVGPTNKTASMSQDVSNPAGRDVTYMDLYRACREQVEALMDGGVDIILFETAFDTLNVKAGLDATMQVMRDRGCKLPVMLSLTLAGKSGRTLSGQTLAAFLASVRHVPLACVGLNCSFGAVEMLPHLRELSAMASCPVSAYPNAGLPNAFGEYDETPETMESHVRSFIEEGLVNIIGGCCGTTPRHIARFPALVKDARPRRPAPPTEALWLSGLERLEVKPENGFIRIGERCNVAGSRKFLRLIGEGRHEEALSIARKQVEDGAQVIDINMDDGLLDAAGEITVFLNLIASDPDIARVPVMIDSSKWDVIEQALYCVQGKSIVNSISLKEGEEVFLAHAARIRQLGAAAVVMAFDGEGQADTYERKIAVCERAYRLLTEKAGFPPQDIIFDPNVLAIATGIPEHNGYGLAFIRAAEWIRQHLPGAKVSGGVSNLSFSFRGNSYVREAMHAVFLHHAVRAGMDMGIVNPSTALAYEVIDPPFRALLEDVILARRPEAADELIARAQEQLPQETGKTENAPDAWRCLPPDERLEYALIKGITDYLETDLAEALQVRDGKAVAVVDGPLMNGMNRVGELFGAGRMFLPQVVRTARTMKRAVSILQPAIEADRSATGTSGAGKVVFATVKGDVHDIGKNIVSIVLKCNNYEVVDLGVMVPAERILEAVLREKPDLLCLSGLITPSLEEMIHVADTMQQAGQCVPILVGGATTSKLHTALKIAPHYDHPVIHVTDASQNPLVAARLLNPATREAYICELNGEYERLRHTAAIQKKTAAQTLLPLAEARARRPVTDWTVFVPVAPRHHGVRELHIRAKTLLPYINWVYFFVAWRLNGRYGDLSQLHGCMACRTAWLAQFPDEERAKAREAATLYDDARALLHQLSESGEACCRALYGIFPAASDGDDIRIGAETLSVLRQQTPREDNTCLSLADFVMPASAGRTDYVGAFALTTGTAPESLKKQLERDGDSYHLLLLQTISDRLAEACAEYLHEQVRREYWGYAADENLSMEDLFKAKYRGIRPAVGYPSLPDQQQLFTLDALLHLERIGIRLTENGAMFPTSSIAGFYFAHPHVRYFTVGAITDEQLYDYAARRRENPATLRKFLQKNSIN
ncbi:MAG: methionine synthase [Tannerella sp.]|jgi:5-methyltetrahydrofolate--homocysteine methyltransferase|nr:methionine synthase [Tannerella sp.]